jgi:hypothetical protein
MENKTTTYGQLSGGEQINSLVGYAMLAFFTLVLVAQVAIFTGALLR